MQSSKKAITGIFQMGYDLVSSTSPTAVQTHSTLTRHAKELPTSSSNDPIPLNLKTSSQHLVSHEEFDPPAFKSMFQMDSHESSHESIGDGQDSMNISNANPQTLIEDDKLDGAMALDKGEIENIPEKDKLNFIVEQVKEIQSIKTSLGPSKQT